ncbi:MAG: MBL fold metallo-hydrolase [Kiritimatiellae bacterium]|nr:MBL fold metallo-hydrolase [Kiritimatiellia bacterium]
MKIAVLASGSSGNFTFVSGAGSSILVDAGTCCRTVCSALASIGQSASGIDGVFITHDHSDHVKALATLEKKHGFSMPLYATDGTIEAVCAAVGEKACEWPWTSIAPGEPFRIGALEIEAFSVPHDAADPVGCVISDGAVRYGIATDLGSVPESVRFHLRDCDALSLEFNHDSEMLMQSSRPWSLKQRISGRSGHLCNCDAAALLAQVATPRLKAVFPVHLSAECNAPHLALDAAREAVGSLGLDPAIIREPRYPTPVVEL